MHLCMASKHSFCCFFYAGPPALVGVSDCLIQNQCEYPRLSISAAKEYFRVYVRFAGPGPFTVTWHYSSGKPVDCSSTDSRCHIVTNYSTNVSVGNSNVNIIIMAHSRVLAKAGKHSG